MSTNPAPKTDIRPCKRCQGTGNLPFFAHVMNGRCFGCDGAGMIDYVERRARAARDAELAALIEREHAIKAAMQAAGIPFRPARTLAASWFRAQSGTTDGTLSDELIASNAALVDRFIAGDADVVPEILATVAAAKAERKAARA